MKSSLTDFDLIKSPFQFQKRALALFSYQHQNNSIYRSYCDLINISPTEVNSIKKIPFLPIQFFKSHKVICKNTTSKFVFESSKTTDQNPSRHYIEDLNLYIKSFEKGFKLFYGNIEDFVILALLPSYLERENSSLVYMINHLIKKTKNHQSGFYLNEIEELKTTLESLEQNGQKTLLLGVSFALLNCVENHAWKLKNTYVMETGGMKGMRKELIRSDLHKILKDGFKVNNIHSEYGMTELLSQAYSKVDGHFYCPPWMNVITRSLEDPFEILDTNKIGAINVIDLANVNSCAFIATQDLGKTHENGSFEVLGRFDQAEIRGCNLMVV